MIKIAFVTCVQIGLSCIEEIYSLDGKLDLLITLKDNKSKNKSGRIYLDGIASKYNIPLLKIDNINNKEVINILKKNEISWLFIIGWSQIAHEELLEAPSRGCIGMHPTLLPEGRGRAAVPWAIIKKLDKTGVTMFKLDKGIDTGDIIAQGEIPLDRNITATELYQRINEMHANLIRKTWDDIINDRIILFKQDHSKATQWSVRTPSDGEIKPQMTMDEALTLIRATTHPYPGAFFINKGRKIIVWNAKPNKLYGEIELKDGFIEITDYEIK